MIIEAALGDAYASHFLKMNSNHVKEFNVPSKYTPEKLNYSSLTQAMCTIAGMVTIKLDFDVLGVAQALTDAYIHDKREGYDRRINRAFRTAYETGQPGHAIVSKKQNIFSGAAVRALPLGFYDNPETIIAKCAIQSSLTNLQNCVVDASCIVGLIAYLFLAGEKRSAIPAFLTDIYPRIDKLDWSEWHGPVPKNSDLSIVMAALTVLKDNLFLSSCLEASVNFGGHTNAVATIALGLGSLCSEIEDDLEEKCSNLLDRFKQTEPEYDNLVFLDNKLVEVVDGTEV